MGFYSSLVSGLIVGGCPEWFVNKYSDKYYIDEIISSKETLNNVSYSEIFKDVASFYPKNEVIHFALINEENWVEVISIRNGEIYHTHKYQDYSCTLEQHLNILNDLDKPIEFYG